MFFASHSAPLTLFSCSRASLLKVEPSSLLSVDVAANGDLERKTLTIDELVTDGVTLPQPRPLIVGHKLK
jgi:hypothetical protein